MMQLITTAIGIYNNYSPVPYWDLWPAYVFFNTEFFKNPIGWLFNQHVDHFIVVQNLISLADWNIFGGKLIFCEICTYLFAVLLAYLSALMDINKNNKPFLFGLLFLILMSWIQYENFTWAFQTQMFSVLIFAALSFLLLNFFSEKEHGIFLALSMLSATLSMISMGNGLIVFPLLFIYSVVLKLSKKSIFLVFVVASILTTIFLINFKPSAQSVPFEFTSASILRIVTGLFMLIGAPVKFINNSIDNIYILSTGIILFAINISCLCRIKNFRSPVLFFNIFLFFTCCIVTLGRANLNAEFWYTSRYMTTVMAYWATIFLLVRSQEYSRIMALKLIVILSLSLSLIFFQINAFKIPESNKGKFIAMIALNLKINDQEQLNFIFPWPEILLTLSEPARRNKNSIFFNPLVSSTYEIQGDSFQVKKYFGLKSRPINGGDYSRVSFVYDCNIDIKSPKKIIFLSEDNNFSGQGLVTNFENNSSLCLVDGYVIEKNLNKILVDGIKYAITP